MSKGGTAHLLGNRVRVREGFSRSLSVCDIIHFHPWRVSRDVGVSGVPTPALTCSINAFRHWWLMLLIHRGRNKHGNTPWGAPVCYQKGWTEQEGITVNMIGTILCTGVLDGMKGDNELNSSILPPWPACPSLHPAAKRTLLMWLPSEAAIRTQTCGISMVSWCNYVSRNLSCL